MDDMEWYYAQDGQQKGPVSEVELAGLVTSGVVTEQTLVWRAGMANWQPYGEVKSGIAPPAAAPPPATQPVTNEVACVECGRHFPPDQIVRFGEASVCASCKPVFVQKMKEGVAPAMAGPMEYAGFWTRFAAKFIDWLIMGALVGIPFVFVMWNQVGESAMDDGPPPEMLGLQVLLQVVAIVFTVAYNTFFIGKYGATLGKMACGIKAVTADGDPVSYWRAFGRAWAEQLSGMICYIGYIIAGFDDQRRALHDHICNTRVIKK